MNQEPEARRLKRAAPKRRTIAAIAIGAMAIGGVAALPLITAQAVATTAVSGVVVTSAAGNAVVAAGTVTAYRVTGSASTATATATISAGAFDFGNTLDTANSYKFKVAGTGFQTAWYKTASGATPYAPTTGNAATFADATAITPVVSTVLSSGAQLQLTPAGAAVSTTTVTLAPINNDGTLSTGSPAIGQKARLTVAVTGSGTPSGFVTLTSSTAFVVDGSQMATLSGGTATIDVITTAAAGTTQTAVVDYSGDSANAPSTVTKSDIVIAAGAGTLTGVVNVAGPTALAGVTVTAFTNPTTGTPVEVSSATTDSAGAWRLTLANAAVDGYKIRYSRAGHISEWELTAPGADNGVYSFAAAGPQLLNSNAPTALSEIIATVGTTTPVISLATSPNSPRTGQTVTYTVTVTGAAAVGSVRFADLADVSKEVALNGSGVGVLTRTFSTVGAQSVVIAFSGDGTRAAGTVNNTVTISAGSVISGIVSDAGGPINGDTNTGARVGVYNVNTGAAVPGSPFDVNVSGAYEAPVVDGSYKVRFIATNRISEWHENKTGPSVADVITIAGAGLTLNNTLATPTSLAANTATVVTTPAQPIVGQPYTGVVTVSNSATGSIYLRTPLAVATTAVQLVNGVATVNFPAPTTAGAQTLAIDYSGDAANNAQTSISLAGVTAVTATSVTVTSNVATQRSGTNVVLTATVLTSAGAPVADGTGLVTFKRGSTTLGVAQNIVNGRAALTYAPTIGADGFAAGANAITATYAGVAGTNGASTSAAFNQTVVANQGRLTTVSPFRVLQPTAVAAGASTNITFTDIPVGAVAVQLNVTASGVNANTYLSVCPGGTAIDTCKLTSTVNTSGADTRNFAIVPLGGTLTDTVMVYNNAGSTLVSADVFGWVIDAPGTDGSLSVYSPTRFGDPIPMGPGSVSTVTFDDVPAGATAIALNVTVAGVTANTYVSACPPSVSTTVCKEKSIINSAGKDMANFVIVPLGGPAMNKVKFYNNAGTISSLLLDVSGYVLGSPSGASIGRFQAAGPTRAIAPTTIAAGTFANITLTGVPAGATAVALNLTGAGVNANTYYSVCPGNTPDATCKTTSVLNSAGPDTAGFVIVQLGAGSTVKIYNNAGTPLAIGDVFGWVIG